MCKTVKRFATCAVHGTIETSNEVCGLCLKANADLHAAYLQAARALDARVSADKCRTPFPQRKAWPEWVANDAANAAFFAAVPRLNVRMVTHERKPENKRETCGAACLNGKRACSCVCGGFCHGAGECRCQTPEGKAYRDALWASIYASEASA